jgi:6-phosphofructo-2-kinase/fructose-2,6-biphosphatase 2
MAYGCHEERYPLPIAAVDTHRPKPTRNRNNSLGAGVDSHASEPPSRAPPARDYFGDVSKHMASPANKEAQQEAPIEALKALERDADQGLLTPKAVKGP